MKWYVVALKNKIGFDKTILNFAFIIYARIVWICHSYQWDVVRCQLRCQRRRTTIQMYRNCPLAPLSSHHHHTDCRLHTLAYIIVYIVLFVNYNCISYELWDKCAIGRPVRRRHVISNTADLIIMSPFSCIDAERYILRARISVFEYIVAIAQTPVCSPFLYYCGCEPSVNFTFIFIRCL